MSAFQGENVFTPGAKRGPRRADESRMETSISPAPTSEELADRCFKAARFDFGSLVDHPRALVSRPLRRGVAIVGLRSEDLPPEALDAILSWRLGQYLLTGFYDPEMVAAAKLTGESPGLVSDRDVHGLAIDSDGDLAAYLTVKQPPECAPGTVYGDPHRPRFPCEEVHGRAWQKSMMGAGAVDLLAVRELARFVKDQRRPHNPACLRAPLELGLATARLARHPRFQEAVRLVTGDLDPEVALKSLRFFFIPVATCAPHHVKLEPDNPLRPRYRDHATAPFLAAPSDVDNTTYIRWSDIGLALDCADEEALMRLLALRQFVRVKESSLKRPLSPPDDSPYPTEALAAASSREVSFALWDAAGAARIPWRALELGPGEALPRGDAFWIVDGFAQALARAGGKDRSHLAGLGPEVAFLPHHQSVSDVAVLDAVTPLRALVTSQEHFEDFWRQRQTVFETTTETLYD
jgi:hypothetical protein